jgi:trimeric autotransporter adhesin
MKQTSLLFAICKRMLVGISLILFLTYGTKGQQSASYNLNSIPISGANNSAFGFRGLFSNTSGSGNTAIGHTSLFSNTTGGTNTAVGHQSLYSNTTGNNNMAIGYGALYSNISGGSNTAIGPSSLVSNTTGNSNTAIGFAALSTNTTGETNTAIGGGSLNNNTVGNNNTGIGTSALFFNTSGIFNTAIGGQALVNNNTGSYNTFIGSYADVGSGNLSNSTAIGNGAIVNVSNTIQLGNNAVTQMYVGTGTNAKVIAGGLQITGGSLGAGKVLTSDAFGVATWQVPSGGGTSHFTDATIGAGNIINTNTGGVIIGTGITSAPAGYKLYVSDGIITEKVKVAIKNSTDWADYVFEKNYHLPEIGTLAQYIAINKHLPGIPSANEIAKDGGFELGKTTIKLLEKIEELTLYVIQLKKEIDEIKLKETAKK